MLTALPKIGMVVFSAVFSLSSLVLAEAPSEPLISSSTQATSVSPDPLKSELINLDFQEADIRNVLKVLAFKTGMNIVAGPEVSGNVTIQLKDVPWQKALEVVLSTYGFGYEMKGNIIKVMTIDSLKKYREDKAVLEGQEPVVTKTYILNFAKASDVIESLGKMKTDRGSINFDQRTNTLIVRDVQSNLDLISEVVRTLDSVTPQVLIEIKVVETRVNHNEKLGIEWQVRADVAKAYKFDSSPFPISGEFNYGTLSAQGLEALLSILDDRTDTHIISNPKIVTLDNQPAKITVGTQFPIPQYTFNQEQGRLQVSGFEFKDIGIVLEVTPHVNNANLVTLELHPKITDSDLTTDIVTFESTQLPIISIEEVTTRIMVKNGQTLVMAGLIKDKTVSIKKKVPFLGDIPFIGAAFRSKTDTKVKTELLILLTPHIVTAQSSQKEAGIVDDETTPIKK